MSAQARRRSILGHRGAAIMAVMSAKLTRRSVLGLVLSSSSAALLAACTASPQTPGPTPASVVKPIATNLPAQADATPKSGGKLTVGLVGDIITLDGHSQAGPLQVNVVWHHFDKLTEYDDNVVP